MPSTATHAFSTADTPRQYEPFNYYHPNRQIAFDWELAPVGEGVPVVTLSVAHHTSSKTIGVEIYTAVADGNSKLVRFAWKGDKWADRRVTLFEERVPRFNRKKLEEAAAFWLAEVQANPESFAEFFVTDETAARS